jgi:hypothetical protein
MGSRRGEPPRLLPLIFFARVDYFAKGYENFEQRRAKPDFHSQEQQSPARGSDGQASKFKLLTGLG